MSLFTSKCHCLLQSELESSGKSYRIAVLSLLTALAVFSFLTGWVWFDFVAIVDGPNSGTILILMVIAFLAAGVSKAFFDLHRESKLKCKHLQECMESCKTNPDSPSEE